MRSQKEMFADQTLAPEGVPRLTALMASMLTALMLNPYGVDLRASMGHPWWVTRTLRILIRKRCVAVSVDVPRIYTVTRLGHIAWNLHK